MRSGLTYRLRQVADWARAISSGLEVTHVYVLVTKAPPPYAARIVVAARTSSEIAQVLT